MGGRLGPARLPCCSTPRAFVARERRQASSSCTRDAERNRHAPAPARFGPRTAAAGFTGSTWWTTSQSQSARIAAGCCFTVGADPGCVRMQAATWSGAIARSPKPRAATPPQEPPRRTPVGGPRPVVRDRGREELQEPLDGRRPRVDDHLGQRHGGRARTRDLPPGHHRHQRLAHPDLSPLPTIVSKRS